LSWQKGKLRDVSLQAIHQFYFGAAAFRGVDRHWRDVDYAASV
jgi:hypothetical protein